MQNIFVMQMVHSLKIGGSEKIASTISSNLNNGHFQSSICALDIGGELIEELAINNIPHHILHRKGIEFDVSRRIYRLLKKFSVDIVHTHHFAQLFYTVVPACLAGVKIVHTEHEYNSYLENNFSRKAIKPLSYFCKRFTTVSQDVADYFIREVGLPAARVTIVRNGIDIRKFDIQSDVVRKELGISDDAIVFGTVGRLEEEKDHRTLLNAFSKLSESDPRAKLLMIGDGRLRKELETHANALGLGERILFLGSRTDVPEVLSAIDVFVLTSIREGLPIAVIEAMGARKPVICTDVGSMKSLVQDGINGLLVPPRDEDAICRALLKMQGNPAMRKEMGERGHDLAQRSFSLDSMIEQYERIYRSMIRDNHVWN